MRIAVLTPYSLREAREHLGMTQRDLAQALGVRQVTIWRWETGQHPIQHPTILRLALERLAATQNGQE